MAGFTLEMWSGDSLCSSLVGKYGQPGGLLVETNFQLTLDFVALRQTNKFLEKYTTSNVELVLSVIIGATRLDISLSLTD